MTMSRTLSGTDRSLTDSIVWRGAGRHRRQT
jgi:hypothetical protein